MSKLKDGPAMVPIVENGEVVADVYGETEGEALRRAALYKASPEMLEILKTLSQLVLDKAPDTVWLTKHTTLVDAIDQVIAEAGGK